MMHQKRILAGALGCLLICSQPSGYMAAAQIPQTQIVDQQTEEKNAAEIEGYDQTENNSEQQLQSPDQLEPDFNDPDYVKRLWMQENMENNDQNTAVFSMRTNSKVTKSPFTGLSYTHAARLSDSSIVNGIDVSKWQADIDWKKVKAAGVKFVFIRCGYTSLSEKFAMYEDPYFKQNIQGAYNAGIKVGIYFFSNSITVSEAQKEAEKTIELIKSYKNMITLPVVYDFEAFSNAYRAYGTSKAQVTKNALAYMKAIQGAGYKPMYYGSPNFLNSSFDVSKLTDYDCWLANYTTSSSYTGDYVCWQYSSTGTVDGTAGNVDCNFYYDVSNEEIPEQPEVVEGLGPVTGLKMSDNTSTSITITWNKLNDAAGYKIYRSKSYGGIYKQMKVINENTVTEFTDYTVMESEGRQYFYKVVPYIIEAKNTDDNTGTEPETPDTDDSTGTGDGTGDGAAGTQTDGLESGASGTEEAGTETEMGTDAQSGASDTQPGTTETVMKYGAESKILTAYTLRQHTFRLKTTTNLNLREQAGTEYPSVAVVPSGTGLPYFKYTLSTLDKKWYKVTYKANGKSYTGYLSGSYVNLYTYGKTTKKVNLRSGAGLSYKIARTVPKGIKVTIISSKKDAKGTKWNKISYKVNGKKYTGFVPAKYINQV